MTYELIGRMVTWLFWVSASVGLLAISVMIVRGWIIDPFIETQRKLGQQEAVKSILRDAYWFSEHPPTVYLIRELSKLHSEGAIGPIEQIRDSWRKEMKKT